MLRTLPESFEHEQIKNTIAMELDRLPEIKGVQEYPVAGHRADVYGLTTDGIKVCFEIIWSDKKTHFESDLKQEELYGAYLKENLVSRAKFDKNMRDLHGKGLL